MVAGEGTKQIMLTGSDAAAASEATETRFEMLKARINAASDIAKEMGEITAKQPAAVATPLPLVLNFR